MNNEEKQKNYERAAKLLAEQNFAAAVVVGAVATLLAAVAYGITVAIWAFSYGFAAAGVGVVIGLSMQFLGRGIETRFRVAATLYAITGCALGNVCRTVIVLAQANAISPVDVLRMHSLSVLAERSMNNISLVDFVYWFVAVVGAVFLARRPLSRADKLAIGLFEMRS